MSNGKMNGSKKDKLRQIKQELENLKELPLYEYRQKHDYQPVLGEGNVDAEIVFIGEAPGENEAKTGRPFCGAAGRILDKLLESAAIDREDVYITNIVNDRPPGNRDPKPEEIKLYSPFLMRLINVIEPKVLAPLGRFAMNFLMKHYGLQDELERISLLHGKVFKAETEDFEVKIMPLFHPAVGLYQATKVPQMKNDFQKLAELAACNEH